MIREPLLADDSTLSHMDELKEGQEVFTETMMDFEERCHDGKEDLSAFEQKMKTKQECWGPLLAETKIGRKGLKGLTKHGQN